MIQSINDSTFTYEVLQVSHNIPVLIYCYTETCAPCKALSVNLEKIANQKHNFTIKKINVNINTQVLNYYQIKSVPTLILFVNGNVFKRTGFLSSMNEIITFATTV